MAERGLGAPPHARGAAPARGCSAPGSWGARPGSRLQKETIFFFWFCSRIFPACLEKMARRRGCEGAGEVAPVPPHAVFSISILGASGSKGLGRRGGRKDRVEEGQQRCNPAGFTGERWVWGIFLVWAALCKSSHRRKGAGPCLLPP